MDNKPPRELIWISRSYDVLEAYLNKLMNAFREYADFEVENNGADMPDAEKMPKEDRKED